MSARGGPPTPKAYSNLDLIKADTPHTPAKISKMLHQLEFKLRVEMQYKLGIDKMAKLYQADGDKKSRQDAESKKVESEKKIQLLQSALKRYKNLHVLDDVVEEEVGKLAFFHIQHITPLSTPSETLLVLAQTENVKTTSVQNLSLVYFKSPSRAREN